jgi:hypothetical protein
MDPFHNGLEILLPFALDRPTLYTPCKPAYALSNRNDRLLFVQDYTHAYTRPDDDRS